MLQVSEHFLTRTTVLKVLFFKSSVISNKLNAFSILKSCQYQIKGAPIMILSSPPHTLMHTAVTFTAVRLYFCSCDSYQLLQIEWVIAVEGTVTTPTVPLERSFTVVRKPAGSREPDAWVPFLLVSFFPSYRHRWLFQSPVDNYFNYHLFWQE